MSSEGTCGVCHDPRVSTFVLDDICVFVVDGSYRVKSVVSVGSYRVASYRVKSVVSVGSDRVASYRLECVVSVGSCCVGWYRGVASERVVQSFGGSAKCEGTDRACRTVLYRFSVDQLLRRYRSGVLIRVGVVGVYVYFFFRLVTDCNVWKAVNWCE